MAPTRRSGSATAGLLVVSWLVLLGVVIGVGLLLTHPLAGSVGSRENDLARWFADRRTPTLTTLADALTTPGNTIVAVAGAAVLALLVGLLGHSWRQALYVVLGVGGVYGIYLIAFSVVPRDRPPVKILDPGLVPTHSFPSGHVAAATVLYGAVAVLVRARWPAFGRPLAGLLLLVPLLVLVSRLYLGAHHLSDTLTSLLFASAWLAVLTVLLRPASAMSDTADASTG